MKWHIHFLPAAEKGIDARHLSLGQHPVEQAVVPPNSKVGNALTRDILLNFSKSLRSQKKGFAR